MGDGEIVYEKKIVLFDEESDGSTNVDSHRASHVEADNHKDKPSAVRLEIDHFFRCLCETFNSGVDQDMREMYTADCELKASGEGINQGHVAV